MVSGLYKRPFPGLGIAAGLFAAYVVVDNIANVGGGHDDHGHHAEVTYEKKAVGEMPTRADGDGGGDH